MRYCGVVCGSAQLAVLLLELSWRELYREPQTPRPPRETLVGATPVGSRHRAEYLVLEPTPAVAYPSSSP
jgi:hypothetical protein